MFSRVAIGAVVIAAVCSLPLVPRAPAPQRYAGALCEVSGAHRCHERVLDPAVDIEGDIRDGLKVVYLTVGGHRIPAPPEKADAEPLRGLALLQSLEKSLEKQRNPLRELYEKFQHVFSVSTSPKPHTPKQPVLEMAITDSALAAAVESVLQSGVPSSSSMAALAELTRDASRATTVAQRGDVVAKLCELMWERGAEVGGQAAAALANVARSGSAGLATIATYVWTPTWTDEKTGRVYPEIQEMRSVTEIVHEILLLEPSYRNISPHNLHPTAYERFLDLHSALLRHPAPFKRFLQHTRAAALSNQHHFAAQAIADGTPQWDAARAKIAALVRDILTDTSRLPSVVTCRDPTLPAADGDDSDARPMAEQLRHFRYCQDTADKNIEESLHDWHLQFTLALSAWQQVSEANKPPAAVVNQVKAALEGVDKAQQFFVDRRASRTMERL